MWSRETALALLNGEISSYENEKDYGSAACLAMWAGDTGKALEIVIRDGKLDASWLALAPAAGIGVWRALSHLYALQLQDSGDVHRAVMHHLSINDVAAAITAYRTVGYYEDAVLLARCRFYCPFLLRHITFLNTKICIHMCTA